VTFVKAIRVSSVAVLACALAVTLSACGSEGGTPSASTSSSPVSDVFTPPSFAETSTGNNPCPSAAPANAGTPEWTLPGATGSVAVTGPTESTAPRIQVDAPFSVAETQVHALQPGDGPTVAQTAKVSVCYMGVNGRDGSVFDSSYERGAPVDFSLNGVVPGFQKAIAGQKVGSTVAVAMTSADGYPEGQPSAGIQPGDSLIFAIKILDASS
jgi:FKBP-type peptidyl-prolyl isomerase-like protein